MAAVRDGDTIVDRRRPARELDVEVSEQDDDASGWRHGRRPAPRYTPACSAKYVQLVSSAVEAVTGRVTGFRTAEQSVCVIAVSALIVVRSYETDRCTDSLGSAWCARA